MCQVKNAINQFKLIDFFRRIKVKINKMPKKFCFYDNKIQGNDFRKLRFGSHSEKGRRSDFKKRKKVIKKIKKSIDKSRMI